MPHDMPGYLVKTERIAIAGVPDLLIRSLLDRQQFADPLGEARDLGISSAAWPLFGLVWPSGVRMASYLASDLAARLAQRQAAQPLAAPERVLELGCGLALASLVGHRLGVDITASDCHPLAAAFLTENLRLNGLPPMKYRHGPWALADAAPAGLPVPAKAREPVAGQFDLIVGSDVLYERDERAILAGFIARHAAPAAEVWIVDPNRSNRAAFNRQMASLGFDMHQQRLDCAASGETAAYKGRLLVYRRA